MKSAFKRIVAQASDEMLARWLLKNLGGYDPEAAEAPGDAEFLTAILQEHRQQINAAAPEEQPRLRVMPIVKLLKDQRDECATLLRRARQQDDGTWGRDLVREIDSLLSKVPSYEQQLRNVAEGLGMTYEQLIEAVKLLPPMNSGRDS